MAEMQGVPVDDDGGEQVEAGDPVVLALGGAVADFALSTDAQGVLQRVVGFALAKADLARRCMPASRIHSMMNTAGAVAQALERAYRDGVRDGPAALVPMPEQSDISLVEWALIPPRPREGFWSICLPILGGDGRQSREGHLAPAITERGTPGWAIITEGRSPDRVIGEHSIRPLVRLNLLDHAPDRPELLLLTERGRETWLTFCQRGSTRMGIGLVVGDQNNPDRRGFLSHLHCATATRYRVGLVLLCCGAVRCSRGAAEDPAAAKPHRGANAR